MSGISKSYAGVAALTDVSLEVYAGEVHALLGENGAGKSTLMNVASGATHADAGSIAFAGESIHSLDPATATGLGIAIVHQHPAILSDMTVEENIRVAIPRAVLRADGDERATMRAMLAVVGSTAHLADRVEELGVAQKHLLEIAKALVISPRLLILDEPTAPLGQDSVELLFQLVRAAAARGCAVVYITHRLAEVRELADRVTVLRDGKLRGTADVETISDDELLALIVGRQLDSTFPPKHPADGDSATILNVESISGNGFSNVTLTATAGEIVGVAGVVGNGQSQLLRALAGLEAYTGTVAVGGVESGSKQLLDTSAYLPADRHGEGLMMSLSVRENAAVGALRQFTRGPVLSRQREVEAVGRELDQLAVKTPSGETAVASLSGGNQQKVVLARALLARPGIVIADEPTQGVDVGARAEIYKILRETSTSGVPVVVASSDAKELEGLCDRVIVMSRGQVVEELVGAEITEERIVNAAVRSTAQTRAIEPTRAWRSSRVTRFLKGDYAPAVILVIAIVALGGYILSRNGLYLNSFNVGSLMVAAAALGFISLGQTVALMMGGIDLSVGPLAGCLVVIASFFVNDKKSVPLMALGFVLMFVMAAGTGVVNGSLIRFAKFTAVAATLTTYIALQGVSFLLRAAPGGIISANVTAAITKKVGEIPIVFLVLVAITVLMEWGLRRRMEGLRVRAVGSNEESARRVGVKVSRTVVLGYVISSIFVALGAVVLLAQLGIGDPAQGVGYTLSSITAVVLGGTSLLGGRGSFVGTLLGACLIVQALNATTFLGLTQTWQYVFQGGFILVAALLYSRVRGAGRRSVA
ncbi:MAG TPA: ATP-binding cassette domain-containing protein [Micromonosporaceae bacterium]|nr:ATP-binding cassette domain-containing protein [Micromonosporaceae bacterium]